MIESTDLTKIILNSIFSFLVTIAALYFALQKFRVEKWWEKKFQCYIQVLDIMNVLMRNLDDVIQYNNGESHLDKNDLKKINSEFHQFRMQFSGMVTIGTFLLSEEAFRLINEFDSQIYSFDIAKSDQLEVSTIRDNAEGVLGKFSELAAVDLKRNSLQVFI